MLVAMIAGAPVPLTVIQLLWLNLVTDSFPALALGVEKGEPDIMQEPPRDPNEGIIDGEMKYNIIVQSIAIGIATLAAFFIGLRLFGYDSSLAENASATLLSANEHALNGARTMAFVTLVLAELLRAFSARSSSQTILEIGVFTNMTLVKSFLIASALMLIVIYVPFLEPVFDTVFMGLKHWIIIIPLAFIPFIAGELHKISKRKKAL